MNQIEYLPTILDGVTVPTDDLDPELLKSVIVERCGLLEPLYSEPETMKQVISIWFRSHSWNIERLINLIKTAYSPLENYDRHENLSRQKDNTNSNTETRTENRTENRTQNYTESAEVLTNEETERTVAAFNTSEYSPADKTLHDAKTTTETEGSTTGADTGSTTGNTSGSETGNEVETAVNYVHGNIGVTTSQQMFLSEVDLLNGFNVYQFIAEMFSKDLMLSIW